MLEEKRKINAKRSLKKNANIELEIAAVKKGKAVC